MFSSLFMVTAGSPAWSARGITRNLPDSPGTDSRALQAVLKRLSGQRDAVIAIQRELVKRPAVAPEKGGEGEEEKAQWIESWLSAKGLPPAERLDCPDQRVPSKVRPNLVIRRPGSKGPTLWIVGHLDVSPPGAEELWIGSPWALRMEGDTLYGRGVEDNHQSIVSGLLLLEALTREQVTPPRGLGLVYTAGGKQGYPRAYGLEYVLKARPDLFKPGDLIVVNDYGNAQGSVIEVAEKGYLLLKVTVTGKQMHVALPHKGVNALHAGAGLIKELKRLSERFPTINPLFTPEISTFSATFVDQGNGAFNQIPGLFAFYLDCRFMPGYTEDQAEAAVRELADAAEQRDGVSIQLERVSVVPAMPPTVPVAPVVLGLRKAIVDEFGIEPRLLGIGAITLAAELRAKNIPVAVWSHADSLGDAVNERVSITSHIKSMAHPVKEYFAS